MKSLKSKKVLFLPVLFILIMSLFSTTVFAASGTYSVSFRGDSSWGTWVTAQEDGIIGINTNHVLSVTTSPGTSFRTVKVIAEYYNSSMKYMGSTILKTASMGYSVSPSSTYSLIDYTYTPTNPISSDLMIWKNHQYYVKIRAENANANFQFRFQATFN